MTASLLLSTTNPAVAQPQVSRAQELSVIGHLLGRRETVLSIAHAVGLSPEQAQAVCEVLSQRGQLSVRSGERGTLYSLSTGSLSTGR